MTQSGVDEDFLSRIHGMHPDLPVYALTADAGMSEESYLSTGYTGVLQMPVDPRVLEQVIMKHLPEEIMLKPEEGV